MRQTLWRFLRMMNVDAVLTAAETELKAAVGHCGLSEDS